MPSTMHKGVLVLACLACASHGRRVQAPSSESSKSQESVKSLATLLAGFNPEAAAFNPSAGTRLPAAPASANAKKHLRCQDLIMESMNPYDRTEILAPLYTPEEKEEEFDVRKMPGICAPLGFFDPLGFTKGASKEKIYKYREAELRHGRVAMLAAWGMVTADKFHPLFDNKLSRNPLLAIVQVPKLGTLQILLFIAFCEVIGILTSREPGYLPGNFLYSDIKDTAYNPRSEDYDETSAQRWYNYQTKELNNGRLAMFGSIGMLVGSYITGKGPLEVLETGSGVSTILTG